MNVLAIGAHFDDVELGCGGTLAKHVGRGDQVFVFFATLSGFANPHHQIVRSNERALAEAVEAMRILGVKELVRGDFNTLEVEFTDALNIEILKLLEGKQIDTVFTHWLGDVHHDHQAVAKAAIHCCRHIPRVLMYRSNWYESAYGFRGNFYVDITDTWDIKEQALMAYGSEMERTNGKWIRFFKNEAENAGQRMGVKYAEVFELIKWLEY